MFETPSLALPLLAADQAQKHVTHNEALSVLDAIVQLSVEDRDLAAPPDAPPEGVRYIVAADPSGAWAGHAGDVAAWVDGAWSFYQPRKGWRCWVEDEAALLVRDGSAWVSLSSGIDALQGLALLGIGTIADAANPFAAKLNKALWTAKTAAEGGDGALRYTLNKETAADVLSLLMQTGYSGRAEIGLVGDDHLTVKVSADGASWADAIIVDKSDGSVGLGVQPAEAMHIRRTGAAFARLLVEGENGVNNLVRRVSSNATQPNFYTMKARGTIGAETAILQNDQIGAFGAQAYDGAGYRVAFQLTASVIAPTPGASDMEARAVIALTPVGSVAAAEILRLDHATGLSMFGANPVVDGNRHLRLRSYTIAALPAASAAAGQVIFCSDLGGGGGQLNSDGANWRRVSKGGLQTIATDAAVTLTPLTSAEQVRHTGILTADRSVTLATANAYPGASFRVTRSGGGAFNLSIGGLKTLATNTWCEVVHDGSAWVLAASGTL